MEAKQAMRSEAGFTLLELLVAVTILAFGLIATVSMQTTAIRADSIAQRTSALSGVARAAMDELLSQPGANAIFQTAQTAAAYDLDPQTLAATVTVQGITYSATITIVPNATVNAVSVPLLTQIGLTVVESIPPFRSLTLTELKRAV